MKTVFVSERIWPALTKSVRRSPDRCLAAVAFFGKGAAKLLPLARGSRIVVDASDAVVKSGQTHPADLLKLVGKGVRVFSLPGLHAKVFVIGRSAWVGSANVSNRSAGHLVEAGVQTTERRVVAAARKFVLQSSVYELSPKLLKRLSKIYRPPKIPNGLGRRRASFEQTMPRSLLAQLELEDWSDDDKKLQKRGLVIAKHRKKARHGFRLDSFRYVGRHGFKPGDMVIQVTDEGNNYVLVSPPGNVSHIQSRQRNRSRVSFIFLEVPVARRRRVTAVARSIGRGTRKALRREGLIRDKGFAKRLLQYWASCGS